MATPALAAPSWLDDLRHDLRITLRTIARPALDRLALVHREGPRDPDPAGMALKIVAAVALTCVLQRQPVATQGVGHQLPQT
jgi:hypothetical protein